MKKIKTLAVDIYEPSKEEEIIYRIAKHSTSSDIQRYTYSKKTIHKVSLNMYGELEYGISYQSDPYNKITVWVKNGKLQLDDEFYLYSFDGIEAEEKSLEIRKRNIAKRKEAEEAEAQETYDELKDKYGEKEWFK